MIRETRPDPPTSARPSAFQIEDCVVLPTLNRIERDGEVYQIEPRVMQVLVCLARHPGAVLSRQELFEIVWADSVVCEEALTRTISELRRVFRDDTKTPRVIETIRKGGYRLIAPVSTVSPVPPESMESPESPESPHPSPPAPSVPTAPAAGGRMPATAHIVGWTLAALALLSLSIWGIRRFTRTAPPPTPVLEVSPLTSDPGLELFPALSPNGSMVAFSWAGKSGGDASALDLYVMKIPGGTPVRLTNLTGSECFPSWSPDGSEIAFSCDAEGGSEICTMSVSGGDIRRWIRLDAPTTGLDWSPDGQWIVYATADSSMSSSRIHLLRLKDLSRRILTHPAPGSEMDVAPAFSPDSRAIAFIRANARQENDAWCVPIAGGAERKQEIGGRKVSGVDWLSPTELVLSASSKIDTGLWKVPIDSGKPSPLSIPGGRIQRVSCGENGRRLAYEKISFAQSIWCIDLSPAGASRRRSEPLIASTQRESEPVFSPDGRAIAFVSDRSGSPEVWIADAAGGHARRLTDQKTTLITHPRWSPDGTRIAYSCTVEGRLSIQVTDVSSRIARPLLRGGPFTLGVWSSIGDFIYYGADTPAGAEVWRVRADGTGPTRIAGAGWGILGESPDGRGLLCARSDGSGIWLLPFDGGPESEIVPAERCRDWQETVVADEGFYFLRRGRERSTLGFYDVATQRSDSLASIEWYAASLDLAPDRSMLVYDSIGKLEIDLMLAEVPE
jgi:Tol biopolymer transport system component/DNA-binding winged helix-turn-helix (wHTH) protein